MKIRRAPRLRSTMLATVLAASAVVPLAAPAAAAEQEDLRVVVVVEDGFGDVITDGIGGMTVRAIRVNADGSPVAGTAPTLGAILPGDVPGEYTIADLPVGSYKVEAFENVPNTTSSGNPSEYARVWSGNQATFSQASVVVIDGDTNTSHSITLQSPTAGFIYVTTSRDGTNEFITGVCATAYDMATGFVAGSGWGDGTSQVQIRALRPGNYKVELAGTSLIPGDCGTAKQTSASEWYLDKSTIAQATPVLVEDNTTTQINASLAATTTNTNRTISGTVTASGGGAILAINVTATEMTSGTTFATTTNSSGGYQLAVDAGRYRVFFEDRDQDAVLYASEYYQNASTPETATAVDVSSSSATGIDAVLDVGGTVSGTVTKPDGADADTLPDAAAGATVGLYRQNDSATPFKTVTTATDGTYAFSGLFPDSYRMKITPSPSDSSLASEWYLDASDFATATNIDLSSGQQRTGVDTLLDVPASFIGNVTSSETGSPRIVGACVAAYTAGGQFAGSTLTFDDDPATLNINEKGDYKLSLGLGQYKLRFSHGDDANCPGGRNLAAIKYASEFNANTLTFDTAPVLTLKAGGQGQSATLDLAAGTLSGTATAGSPAAVRANVCVRVFDSAGRILRERATDASGFWSVGGIAPQVVRVEYRPDLQSGDDCYATAVDRLGGSGTATDQGPSTAQGATTAEKIGLANRHHLDKLTLADATPVGLFVGANKTDINQFLPQANANDTDGTASISGVVTEPDGPDGGSAPDPVGGVCVIVVPLSGDGSESTIVASAVTATDGSYTVSGLKEDTLFRVRFSNDPQLCTTGRVPNPGNRTGFNATEWYANKASFSEGNAVRTAAIGASTQVTGINEQLPWAGLISGTVTDAERGGGIAATVTVYAATEGSIVRTLRTTENGTYTIGSLPMGDYKVGFKPFEATYRGIFHENADSQAAAAVVSVGNSTNTNISVALKLNHAPVAADDDVKVELNSSVTFAPLANDVDQDGDKLTITTVSTPNHGTAKLNADATVTYTPEKDNNDPAVFSYTIKDPAGLTSEATVRVTVVGEIVGAPPTAADDSATTDLNVAVTVDVLANDDDPDGDRTKLTISSIGTPFHGTAVVNAGKIRFTPDRDFSGTDQFVYEVQDAQGFTASAKVTITVRPEENPNAVEEPVAAGGSAGTDGEEAAADNTVITTVTSPNAGTITIEETEGTRTTSNGLTIIEPRVKITAPDATAAKPLVITFRLDGSVLQGEQPQRAIRVLRNGAGLSDCLGSKTANPDPCIAGHQRIGDDLLLTVLTSKASTWTFGFLDEAVVDRAAVQGAGRVDTAVRVARQAFNPSEVDTVIIARSDSYPDALAGAPLAHQVGAPLLLTNKAALDVVTRDEILRLGPSKVIILGGPNAVSTGVENTLKSLEGVQSVERISGTDRYKTSVEIAKRLDSYTSAYVVEGYNDAPGRGWPDAVAVSSLAAFQGRPILLTSKDALPAPTRAALSGLASATVIGGPGAVSDAVLAEVDEVVGTVSRISGNSRYETSYQIVLAAQKAGMSASSVWVATGLNFPDALAAGAAVAKEGGILMLVHGTTYGDSPRVREFLQANRATIESVTITGGTGAVSVATEASIRRDVVT